MSSLVQHHLQQHSATKALMINNKVSMQQKASQPSSHRLSLRTSQVVLVSVDQYLIPIFSCSYRLAQEGALSTVPFLGKRVVQMDKENMEKLLMRTAEIDRCEIAHKTSVQTS